MMKFFDSLSEGAIYETDPFFQGFAEFLKNNFSRGALITLAEAFSNANRFQKGHESIRSLLNNRGDEGKMILRVIELYISQTGKNFNIDAKGSAGHLQSFSETAASTLH